VWSTLQVLFKDLDFHTVLKVLNPLRTDRYISLHFSSHILPADRARELFKPSEMQKV